MLGSSWTRGLSPDSLDISPHAAQRTSDIAASFFICEDARARALPSSLRTPGTCKTKAVFRRMPFLPRTEIACCNGYGAVGGIVVCARPRGRYSISVREARAFLRRCSALRRALCRARFRCCLVPLLRNGVSSAARRDKVGRLLSCFARACLRLLSRISLLVLRSLCHRSSSWGLLPVKDHGSPEPRIREGEALHS